MLRVIHTLYDIEIEKSQTYVEIAVRNKTDKMTILIIATISKSSHFLNDSIESVRNRLPTVTKQLFELRFSFAIFVRLYNTVYISKFCLKFVSANISFQIEKLGSTRILDHREVTEVNLSL